MGDENNIFGNEENSLLDRFFGILERQTDAKLTPTQLLGFLGLFNLLGIMNLVHGSTGSGIKDVSTLASLSALAEKATKSPDAPALKDALMGLLGGQNQSGPDLGGLLNMIGGNKKINPQMLLTLMSLMNSQSGGAKSDHSAAKANNSSKNNSTAREKTSEVGEDKKRDHTVELKFDKKKTGENQ